MDEWSGFTDEQLKRFKGQDDGTQKPPIRKNDPRKNPSRNRNRTREKFDQKQRDPPLDINQMLSAPNARKVKQNVRKEGRGKVRVSDETENKWVDEVASQAKICLDGGKNSDCKEEEVKEGADSKETVKPVEVNELNEAEGRSRELSQLEIIQKKQMEMEEENRKKKIALTKAINERKKRTQAETKQLAFIQKELGKLESLLSSDVRILREKIESSSLEYNAARRRYEKAESEFVAAKLHLHKVSNHKEALTEHLYTIIQENENRKASKLAELMDKLNVENIDEFIAAAEEEMLRTPTSPTKTAVQATTAEPPAGSVANGESIPQNDGDTQTTVPAAKPLVGSVENGESIPRNTGATSTSDQSSVDLPASTSDSNLRNQHGLETITEVDSEVTADVGVNKREPNEHSVPDKSLTETN